LVAIVSISSEPPDPPAYIVDKIAIRVSLVSLISLVIAALACIPKTSGSEN
jgi:hypothetical protein